MTLIGACAVNGEHVCAADPQPDMKAIRLAVHRNEAALKTLQGKYRWSLVKGESPSARNGAQGVVEFAVDLPGRKIRLDHRKIYDDPGKDGGRVEMHLHTLETFDGSKGYSLDYVRNDHPADSEELDDIPLSLKVHAAPPLRSHRYPWEFTERYVSGRGMDLTQLFRLVPGVEIDRADEIDGVRCPRMPVEELGPPYAIWFDPDHDCLPKRSGPIPYPARGEPPSPAKEAYDVLEFRRFRDLAADNDCWFPVRMQVRDPVKTVDLMVVDLQINPTIDPGRFVIAPEDLPDGVRVIHAIAVPHTTEYTGDRQDLWEEHRRQSDNEAERTSALIDWTPPAPTPGQISEKTLDRLSTWGPLTIGCLAAVVFVLVCVWIRKLRRRPAP